MILKQIPEDFIVEEIPQKKPEEEGPYTICKLEKKNYNTEDAIQTIVKALKIKRKQASYAGNKDRRAVTTQYITLHRVPKQKINNLELKDIKLTFEGHTKKPISLGDLKGNKFSITVRGLKEKKEIEKKQIPNYYDSQRFSTHNVEIGRNLIKRKFQEAINKIMESNEKYSVMIKEHLSKKPNDYVNALKKIPTKVLQIYLYSYQSHLWNKQAEKYIGKPNTKLPLPGFNEETTPELDEIMKEEEITPRDFILREFPEISMEGSKRELYIDVKNLKTSNYEKEEYGYKITLSFEIQKGSYATMVVKHLLNGSTGI